MYIFNTVSSLIVLLTSHIAYQKHDLSSVNVICRCDPLRSVPALCTAISNLALQVSLLNALKTNKKEAY